MYPGVSDVAYPAYRTHPVVLLDSTKYREYPEYRRFPDISIPFLCFPGGYMRVLQDVFLHTWRTLRTRVFWKSLIRHTFRTRVPVVLIYPTYPGIWELGYPIHQTCTGIFAYRAYPDDERTNRTRPGYRVCTLPLRPVHICENHVLIDHTYCAHTWWTVSASS